MVCQDTADSLDNRGRIDTIITDISKVFRSTAHDRLLTKIAASGMDSRVVAWIRESLWAVRRELE
jgi:predicted TIM-barrel enzyme